MFETMKSRTAGKKLGYFNYIIALTFLLMFLSLGCSKEENPVVPPPPPPGGGGGNSTDCQLVATSPGTWDITLNFVVGTPSEFFGLGITQNNCTVTMSRTESGQTVTITGPLSNTGVWTAALTATQGTSTYTANFTATFGTPPNTPLSPYTTLIITTGTDSDGDTISGGFGSITP